MLQQRKVEQQEMNKEVTGSERRGVVTARDGSDIPQLVSDESRGYMGTFVAAARKRRATRK